MSTRSSPPFPATTHTTQFLNRVMLALRHTRSSFPAESSYVRYDTIGRGRFAQVWFATRGCSWDRRGSCTMCNYGTGPAVSADAMVDSVADVLRTIDNADTSLAQLYVSPSGSLLDRTEVPDEALWRIMELVSEVEVPRFGFETRPETIDAATLRRMRRALPDKAINVGVGLESANPMTLRCLINKPTAADGVIHVVELLHDEGIELCANVCVGCPPLTPDEAVLDATASARWTLDAGADEVILFPLHAKRGTVPGWLHARDDFSSPSLWQLVDVICGIPDSQLSRVSISWYRTDYGTQPDLLSSPTTCPDCVDPVLTALDHFRARPGPDTASALGALDCACREGPVSKAPPIAQDLGTRIITMYEMLADGIGLGAWWSANSAAISAEVAAAVEASPPGSVGGTTVTREQTDDLPG